MTAQPTLNPGMPDLGTMLADWQQVPVGTTQCQTVLEINKLRLLRYNAADAVTERPPLLVVYSVINRHTVLDLLPEKSAVATLRDAGFDVYLIDWGVPDSADRLNPFEYYADDLLGLCIHKVKELSGFSQVHLLGYCMGGTMAAVHAACHPADIASLSLLAAPIDFAKGGRLARWTSREIFNVDAVVDAWGNLPAEMMQGGFVFLDLPSQMFKWKNFANLAENKKMVRFFLAMEKWANDNIPFAGEFYRTYIKRWYQDNALMDGTFAMSGRTVDFRSITAPLLVVLATKDHIVPPEAASAILGMTSSTSVEEVRVGAGHIGVSVGGKGFRETWPAIADFVHKHHLKSAVN